MTTLLAYLWTPLLMAALAVGLGLLVERVSRFTLPSALLGPVGAALALPLCLTIYRVGLGAAVATPVVVAAALAGWILARRELRARLRPGWGGAAALAGYLLYVGPSAATGDWTWAGYNFVNDTSVNMIYVDHLIHDGYTAIDPPHTLTTFMQASGVDQRYPMGSHALLATITPLAGGDVLALYQPFLAAVAGGAAAALFQVARRAGVPGPGAAAIGVLAAGANLIYQYGQHGAIKEIVMMLVVATAAAVLAEGLATRLSAGFGAVLGLCLAPPLLVLSVGGAPYVLLMGGLALGAVLLLADRPPLRVVAIAAGTAVLTAFVVTIAMLGDVVSYGQGAGTSFESGGSAVPTPATFGHLVRALPAYQAAGVWLGEDYRSAVPPGRTETIQTVLIAVMLVCALIGLVLQLRRRRFAAPVLFATCGLAVLLLAPRVSPYADAKLLVLLAPPIVLLAGIGIWEVSRLGRRAGLAVAAVLAVLCGGGVLWSDATAAHEVRLAPPDRLDALADAADHAGDGYVLVNEWEEYAKYIARGIRSNSGSESESPDVVVLRRPGPIFAQYFDLDEQALEYLEQYDAMIVRRSPVASRPPGSFRRTYGNDYYEVWTREPGVTVRDHLPLGSLYDPARPPDCADVRMLARRARRAGGELLAAPRGPVPTMDVIRLADRPLGWVPDVNRPRMVTLYTPGIARGTIRVPAGGRYRAWLQLSTGRPMQLYIDGRLVGSPHQVNTPEQWLEAGELQLEEGTHEVELRRRGGRPLVGDGYNGELGPLALQRVEEDPPLERVSPGDAEELCGRRLDWIEVVDR